MLKKTVIKQKEITRVMNHSRLKSLIVDTYIHDPLLQEVLVSDVVGSINQVVVTHIDKEHTGISYECRCVHGFEDLGNGYARAITDPVEIRFALHLSHKGDIFTGRCPKCNRIHVGIRYCENGQNQINY